MARGYRSSSRCYSRSYRSSSKSGYKKSYNNSTRQTCAQRFSPTKVGKTWYDAEGNRVRNKDAYFDTVNKNGRYWEKCK